MSGMNFYYKDKNKKRGKVVTGELFIKISKEVKKNKNNTVREEYKLNQNSALREFLEKNNLNYFIFGDTIIDGKKTPVVVFSKAGFDFREFKNEEGKFKTQILITDDIKKFKEAGIEIPLERISLERISDETKNKASLSDHEYLFELKY